MPVIYQWNRLESLEMHLYIYGHLVLSKGAKTLSKRNGSLFKNQYCRNEIPTYAMMELDPNLTLCININTKWIINLKLREKIIEFLGEILGENLLDLGMNKEFLRHQTMIHNRKKLINWISSKFKFFMLQQIAKTR